jgi:hypothetical protein
VIGTIILRSESRVKSRHKRQKPHPHELRANGASVQLRGVGDLEVKLSTELNNSRIESRSDLAEPAVGKVVVDWEFSTMT